jgi:dihydropteroate synthase
MFKLAGTPLAWQGTAVMGIVNVTPDSFSDGGAYSRHEAAVQHGLKLAAEGALVVDVGGESSRPGAEPVSAGTETERVVPVVRALAGQGVTVSIDTFKPEVAAAALDAGARIINDISGLRDPAMLQLAADRSVPVVLMHMQGEPATMQLAPAYDDVVAEVRASLQQAATTAAAAGVPAVIIDPGIGFGKTPAHNLELLRQLGQLTELGWPVLVGASRKSLLASLAGGTLPQDRDAASIAVHLFAALQGAALVRVHDVAGHVQALQVWNALAGAA